MIFAVHDENDLLITHETRNLFHADNKSGKITHLCVGIYVDYKPYNFSNQKLICEGIYFTVARLKFYGRSLN